MPDPGKAWATLFPRRVDIGYHGPGGQPSRPAIPIPGTKRALDLIGFINTVVALAPTAGKGYQDLGEATANRILEQASGEMDLLRKVFHPNAAVRGKATRETAGLVGWLTAPAARRAITKESQRQMSRIVQGARPVKQTKGGYRLYRGMGPDMRGLKGRLPLGTSESAVAAGSFRRSYWPNTHSRPGPLVEMIVPKEGVLASWRALPGPRYPSELETLVDPNWLSSFTKIVE